LLDYTQLVRHRIANPLTAVIVGIQTMMDIEMEDPLRKQILGAMLESAQRLERVALHPEQVSAEEFDLEPRPAPLDSPQAQERLTREAGQVEADFRDVNLQLIEVLPEGLDHTITFVCECSARDCTAPVSMTLREYFNIHSDGAQFVVSPEHNLPTVEDVIEEDERYWVVKKRGKAGRRARSRA
jgi:signal transduction histidine kinase